MAAITKVGQNKTLASEGCAESLIVINEDFESVGSEATWAHGRGEFSSNFSSFLGRLELGESEPQIISRSFDIKEAADGTPAESVTIEFVLYTIDEWAVEDTFEVLIDNEAISFTHFDKFGASSDKRYDYEHGVTGAVSWWRSTLFQGTNLGYGDAEDAKHLLELNIPGDEIKNGTLRVQFRIGQHQERPRLGGSAGIDDLVIEANYLCTADATVARSHAATQNYDSGVDSNAHAVSPFFCESDDFPCGMDGSMVYVCHFSSRRGHRTLCIHEQDSGVLQFYVHDYCGPCVATVNF